MKNKGLIITLASIGAVLLILIISTIVTYNGLVDKEESVKSQLSVIDSQLTRREELIPNLVNTVKGYVDYEQETFIAVTEARAAVGAAGDLVEKAEATAAEQKAVNTLISVVQENYPDLAASTQFTALTDELAGTANRINQARKDYIAAVNEYNKSIRRFPSNIVASMFGFEQVEYFEANESANSVPEVSFE